MLGGALEDIRGAAAHDIRSGVADLGRWERIVATGREALATEVMHAAKRGGAAPLYGAAVASERRRVPHTVASDGRVTASCLSQWYPAPFTVDGVCYRTAEHWMMAEKARLFDDGESLERILAAPSPGAAKKLGRGVRGFDELRWADKRFAIVVSGSLHKFAQNEELGRFLRHTGKKILVEASPVDRIWGIGLAKDSPGAQNPRLWRGLNLLGFALMDARSRL